MTAIIKQHCCNSAGCQLSQPGLQVVEEAPHSLEIVLKLKRQRAGQSYKTEFCICRLWSRHCARSRPTSARSPGRTQRCCTASSGTCRLAARRPSAWRTSSGVLLTTIGLWGRLQTEWGSAQHACQSSCSSAALEIFGRRAARVDRSDGVLHHEWASNRTTTAMICLGEPITRWQ